MVLGETLYNEKLAHRLRQIKKPVPKSLGKN
jgi:hypothetical protein